MRSLVPAFVLAIAAAVAAGSAAAQQQRGERGERFNGQGFRAPQKMQPGPERRVAEPPRQDPRRAERMTPEDREKLRRDIDDANRGMERRR